jgi:hypothetical protein
LIIEHDDSLLVGRLHQGYSLLASAGFHGALSLLVSSFMAVAHPQPTRVKLAGEAHLPQRLEWKRSFFAVAEDR